jgi:hypothetical protein
MILRPELDNHPKFLGLASKVGGEGKALYILFRLWGHCETTKRGEKWGKVTPHYVETVCKWKGKKGTCFEALVNPVDHGLGWVELCPDGDIVVHGWEEFNGSLLQRWNVGKSGGRPKALVVKAESKPGGNRAETGGGVDDNRAETGRPPVQFNSIQSRGEECTPPPLVATLQKQEEEENAPHIPTLNEMANALASAGVRATTIQKYHDWATTKDIWVIRNGVGDVVLRNWKVEVLAWERKDREMPPPGKRTAGYANLKAEMEDLCRKLRKLNREQHAAEIDQILRRKKELNEMGVFEE